MSAPSSHGKEERCCGDRSLDVHARTGALLPYVFGRTRLMGESGKEVNPTMGYLVAAFTDRLEQREARVVSWSRSEPHLRSSAHEIKTQRRGAWSTSVPDPASLKPRVHLRIERPPPRQVPRGGDGSNLAGSGRDAASSERLLNGDDYKESFLRLLMRAYVPCARCIRPRRMGITEAASRKVDGAGLTVRVPGRMSRLNHLGVG